jgi:photosystem II stability/assembly factor-like uncharacterized protein
MKKLHLIILFFIFFYVVAQAQFNICPMGSYTYGVGPVHAVDDQVFWASRNDATGTIVTTDGGNTWAQSSFTDPKAFPVYCIHAFDANTAFVTASTIYKTTNRGTTWTPAPGVFTNSTSFPNTIHFFDQNNGVAMGDPVDGYFEIYTTSNAGVNWVRVPQGNIPAPLTGEAGIVNVHAYANDSYWFSTTNARLFRSTDRGYTWTCSQLPTIVGGYISMAFRDELHGLADSMIGSDFAIGRTSDGGDTWTYELMPEWITGWANLSYIPGTTATYTINSISYSGNELRTIILFTKDDGLTWNRMDDWGQWLNGDGIGNHQWSSVNSGWGSFWRGNSGYIYHWPGYMGKHIWLAGSSVKYRTTVLGEIGDTAAVNVGSYGTLPTTINSFTLSSANFTVVNPPSTPIVLQPWECIELKIAFTPQMHGILNDSLVINSDAANYSSLSVNISGKAIAFTPPLPDLIYAASDSLYTIDFSNFTPTSVGSFEGPEIAAMTVNPIDSVLIGISMGTSSSILYKIDPILGGCIPLVTIPVGNIRGIAFAPSGTLFGAQKSGSLYKINLNTGEATLIGTATGVQYSSIAFNPGDGRLFASVSKFVGNGKDMICIVDTSTADTTLIGLTGDGKSTPSITFNPKTGQLYGLKGTQAEVNKLITISTLNGSGTEVASLGISGLQTIYISSIIVGVEDEIIYEPTSYELYQNYPNPFNPSTKFRYSIPTQSKVVIKVYDILGNEVATLMDEEKTIGTYEITWNAEQLPSGVYFYQLKAGDYVNTKKMILLK